MHAYMHTYISTYIHTYFHACYLHTCLHAYMHAHIHAHVHTCTHTVLTATGDEQLDSAMEYSALGQEHHVTEFLSDLSYCIYKARQLPKRRLLQVFVCGSDYAGV